MKLLNKDIEYREFSKRFPVHMPAVVLAEVNSERVMIINGEGTVKVIKKAELRVVA